MGSTFGGKLLDDRVQRVHTQRLHLYRLCRFTTARVIHHLHLQDFILGQPDRLNGAHLWRASGNAKKQLRGAVSPVDAQGEMFFNVFHRGLKKRSPAARAAVTGLPRLLEDASAAMLREPRRMPERLGDHLFPKRSPGLGAGTSGFIAWPR
jgi:hypothetical protein